MTDEITTDFTSDTGAHISSFQTISEVDTVFPQSNNMSYLKSMIILWKILKNHFFIKAKEI